MTIGKGLLASLAVLVVGGVFLFIVGNIAPAPLAVEVLVKAIAIICVVVGSITCGYHSRDKWFSQAIRLSALMSIIVIGAAVWFIPQLLSLTAIIIIVGGNLLLSLVGGCFGYNLERAKKALDAENNITE